METPAMMRDNSFWGMGHWCLAATAIVVLGLAALIKYVFFR